jgi:hypothetical protein
MVSFGCVIHPEIAIISSELIAEAPCVKEREQLLLLTVR